MFYFKPMSDRAQTAELLESRRTARIDRVTDAGKDGSALVTLTDAATVGSHEWLTSPPSGNSPIPTS